MFSLTLDLVVPHYAEREEKKMEERRSATISLIRNEGNLSFGGGTLRRAAQKTEGVS